MTKQILIIVLMFLWVVEFSGEGARNSYGKSTKPPPKKPPTPSKIARRGKTSIKRSRRPTRSRPTSRRVSTKSSGYISRFNMQPNLNNVVLYFSPLDIRKRVGEEFVTALALSNRATRYFDRLFIIISYDPEYLEPTGCKDEWLRSLASTPPSAKVYYDEGYVVYEAQLQQPINPDKKNLFFIKWRALKPTEFTQIEFSGLGNTFTTVAHGEDDILGEPTDDRDGVISASVTITTPAETEEAVMPSSSGFTGYFEGGTLQIPEFSYGIHLFLMPEKETVHLNEEFSVHIYLTNKERVPADNLELVIQYNPGVIEVVDYDEGNWITRGINIFDGLYHEAFPFDYQIKNLVASDKGVIYYKMGSSEPDILKNPGTLATIKCKARVGNLTTGLRFIMPDGKNDNATRVTFMNYDVLGSPDDLKDGITNCFIKILQ